MAVKEEKRDEKTKVAEEEDSSKATPIITASFLK